MHKLLNGTALAILCATLSLAAPPAEANVMIHVVQDDPTAEDPSIIPSPTLPSADFIAPDVRFFTDHPETTTLTQFFNNPVFINQKNGFDPNGPADNLFVTITGQVLLLKGTNTLTVGHDDGLIIMEPPGVVVFDEPNAEPGIKTIVSDQPVGGVFDFVLQYAASCDGVSGLLILVNGNPPGDLPEPATMTLLAGGVAGLIAVRRRRTRSQPAALGALV
jgi:hypothetical protein